MHTGGITSGLRGAGYLPHFKGRQCQCCGQRRRLSVALCGFWQSTGNDACSARAWRRGELPQLQPLFGLAYLCAQKTPHCVRELLQHNANVNIQDSYGDTALHDAIGKENTEVVELLCNAPNLDFTMKNNRGFNVLHHAALKGNVVAARRILQLSRQLVNVRKDDGFAALHLAALNGHAQVVETLVTEGQAELDIRNNRRQTPFLLAVSQGHASVIERLVKLSCDVNAKDEDGDNAMHLCVIKKTNLQQAAEPAQEEAPEIHKFFISLAQTSVRNEDRLMYSILIYLSRHGCRVELNNANASIFEWITDRNIRQLIFGQQTAGGTEEPSIPTTAVPIPLQRNMQALDINTSDDAAAVVEVGEDVVATAATCSTSLTLPPPVTQPKPSEAAPSPGNKKLNSDATTSVSPQVAPRKKAPKPPMSTTATTTSTATTCNAATVDANALPHVVIGAAAAAALPGLISGQQECIVCNEPLQLVRFGMHHFKHELYISIKSLVKFTVD